MAPIRDRLNQLGYHAVIVQDEPSLRGSFDLESKVDKYIEAAWGKRGWQSVRLYSLHLPKKMRVRGTYSLVNQSTRYPVELIDMSVKQPNVTEWKQRVRTRIRRSDGVVALISSSTPATTVPVLSDDAAILPSGLSVLTASRGDQTSLETADARGKFSTYLEGALDGGAADVVGHVTVAGLYSYLSESFGAWDQRPTFKANIDRLHDVRICNPRIPLSTLRQIITLFPNADYKLPLDPSFEPTEEPRNNANEAIFSGLQKLRAARLIEPVDEEHMYYAAMNSKGCILTALGKHYWGMVKAGRI